MRALTARGWGGWSSSSRGERERWIRERLAVFSVTLGTRWRLEDQPPCLPCRARRLATNHGACESDAHSIMTATSPFRFLSLLFVTGAFALFSASSHGQDVSTPNEVVKALSDDVLKELRYHRPGQPAPKAALEKANQQLEAYCKGKTGTFSVVVDKVEETKTTEKHLFSIFGKDSKERVLGKSMTVSQGFIVDPSQKDKAVGLKTGGRASATGTPWAILDHRSDGYHLSFWLDKATLK